MKTNVPMSSHFLVIQMDSQRNEALAAVKARIAKSTYDFRDLMAKVTSYLDLKDLRSLSRTCRMWRNAVTREMQFRRLQRVLVYEQENKFVLQNFLEVNPHLVMLFAKHDYGRNVRHEQMLRQQFTNQFPNTLITMGFDEVLTEANIINTDLSYDDERRNFVHFKNCEVPGLLIPYHRSMEIQMVRFTLKEIRTTDCLATTFSFLVPLNPHEKSIVIVFIHGLHQNIYLKAVMNNFEKYYSKDNYTLWGGELFQPPCVHNSKANESNKSDDTGLIAVSISNPNLESYSLVLNIENIETGNVFEEIRSFENGIRFKSQSLGLLIGPKFEDFQMNSDDEESDSQAYQDADDFYKINYEKRLMYYLKKIFPSVHFIFLFQDNLLRTFGASHIQGQRRFYHENSISLMIVTHN